MHRVFFICWQVTLIYNVGSDQLAYKLFRIVIRIFQQFIPYIGHGYIFRKNNMAVFRLGDDMILAIGNPDLRMLSFLGFQIRHNLFGRSDRQRDNVHQLHSGIPNTYYFPPTNGSGSTGLPLMMISKCKCGPVLPPVDLHSPITLPACTVSPTPAISLDKWPYVVTYPPPWSIRIYCP